MRRAAALVAVAFLAAGCGRTYTAAGVQRALAREGLAGVPFDLHGVPEQPGAAGAFPSAREAVAELRFEAPRFPRPVAVIAVASGGTILVYRSPHDAWLAEEGRADLARQASRPEARADLVRDYPPAFRTPLLASVRATRTRRRGNVLLLENERHPELERVAEHLP